jgi:hypothetical protein
MLRDPRSVGLIIYLLAVATIVIVTAWLLGSA